MSWAEIARRAIQRVNDALPDDVSLRDRIKAVDAAYPFGERSYWPHKAWLKARRAYLTHYGYFPKGAPKTPAPLFPNLPRDPKTGRPLI